MSRLDDIRSMVEAVYDDDFGTDFDTKMRLLAQHDAAVRVLEREAPEALLYLLGEVERLTAEAERLRKACDNWPSEWADNAASVSVLTAENERLRASIARLKALGNALFPEGAE